MHNSKGLLIVTTFSCGLLFAQTGNQKNDIFERLEIDAIEIGQLGRANPPNRGAIESAFRTTAPIFVEVAGRVEAALRQMAFSPDSVSLRVTYEQAATAYGDLKAALAGTGNLSSAAQTYGDKTGVLASMVAQMSREAQGRSARERLEMECRTSGNLARVIAQANAAGQYSEAARLIGECVNARLMIQEIEAACRTNSYVGGLLQAKPGSERTVLNDCVQATYRCWADKSVADRTRQAKQAGGAQEAQAVVNACVAGEMRAR